MAELGGGGDSGGGKHGKARAKKSSNRVDMTPMVDLAFLLLTFFVLTTTFRTPQIMEITVPAKKEIDDPIKPTKFPGAITVYLAEKNKIYWIKGELPKDVPPTLTPTSYGKDGIRKVFLDNNKKLNDEIKAIEKDALAGKVPMDSVSPRTNRLKGASMKESNGQYGLLVVIKADDKSSYKNLVDMFDEINITNVANYALVPLTALDKQALEGLK